MSDRSELIELHKRLSKTLDEERGVARQKRYEKAIEQLEKILMI